jgi:3-deoxy-D-manno-octulosonic-acid transferase
VSARLSERSVGHYRRLGGEFAGLVGSLAAVLAQSPEDHRRWLAIGARPERTAVVGNLKADALPKPAANRAEARRELGLDPRRPLLVLGSLRPGEVRVIGLAWRMLPESVRDTWQVVAVPRHARAASELRAEAKAVGISVADAHAGERGWHWDDRAGVLLAYYAAAEVAVVGGSFLQYGGHNPLEPAACGAAVIMGPHGSAQAAGVRALREDEAIWIADDARGLARALAGLLADEAVRQARGARARRVVESQQGATPRSIARLAEWGVWPG